MMIPKKLIKNGELTANFDLLLDKREVTRQINYQLAGKKESSIDNFLMLSNPCIDSGLI